jgi:Flp pilus assembly pilin Flp
VIRRLLRDESGATIVEYAMVLALFALAAMAGFGAIATNANAQYTSSTNGMTAIQESPPAAVAP